MSGPGNGPKPVPFCPPLGMTTWEVGVPVGVEGQERRERERKGREEERKGEREGEGLKVDL